MCIPPPARGEEWGMAHGRRPNILTLRCGAAVLLLAAGTLAAIVVSEWPGRTAPGSPLAGAQARDRLSSNLLPDSGPTPPMPKIVATGSAEEARRDARASGGERAQGVAAAERDAIDQEMRRAWLEGPGPGSLSVDQVGVYDPTRTAATVHITPRLDVTAGLTRFNTGDGPSVGSVTFSDGSRPLGEVELFDFSARLDPMPANADDRRFNAGVIAGLRAAAFHDPATGEEQLREPIPVMGGDARWHWTKRSMLRASALGDIPGSDSAYLDLRLEQVWRIGDASLSLGWRHLRGMLTNETPEPTLRQDAILLELKIGF